MVKVPNLSDVILLQDEPFQVEGWGEIAGTITAYSLYNRANLLTFKLSELSLDETSGYWIASNG